MIFVSIRQLVILFFLLLFQSSYNNEFNLNSDQIQLRLNNGAVVDPDDRVCDVADDREEVS